MYDMTNGTFICTLVILIPQYYSFAWHQNLNTCHFIFPFHQFNSNNNKTKMLSTVQQII